MTSVHAVPPLVSPCRLRGAGLSLAADRWAPRIARAGTDKGVVLFLHGGGQTRHSWAASARRLAEAGWEAVAVDARGHGDSDWAADGDYSLTAVTADIQGVTRWLRRSPIIVGASMGGMTALIAIGERLVTARGLVLADVAPTVESAGADRIRSFMTSHLDGFDSLEAVAQAIAAYNPHRSVPVDRSGLRKNVRLDADGRWRWHWDPALMHIDDEPLRDGHAGRARAAARALDVPTLIIRGAQSDVLTTEGMDDFCRLVPHARAQTVAGGHMVVGDDNEVFIDHLLEFLDGLG